MSNLPRVSVVMSVFNGEKYLREAIDSMLGQTLCDFEFIIIDDGSTDKGLEIIKTYGDPRIIVVEQENTGLAKALNNGIKLARGKYIARMDADDISLPERLEKQYSFLTSHPECVCLGSNADVMNLEGNYLFTSNVPTEWATIKPLLPYISPFFHSSTMFRKDVFSLCGGYNEFIRHHFEDLILWNQMARRGTLRNISDALIKYRLTPASISNRSKKQRKLIDDLLTTFVDDREPTEEDIRKLDAMNTSKSASWKWSNYYLRVGKVYLEQNFKKHLAVRNLILSLTYNPININAMFNLGLCLFPKRVIGLYKKWRIKPEAA